MTRVSEMRDVKGKNFCTRVYATDSSFDALSLSLSLSFPLRFYFHLILISLPGYEGIKFIHGCPDQQNARASEKKSFNREKEMVKAKNLLHPA